MRTLLIITSILFVLVISGCAQQITCNRPYILVGADCCLDTNDNKICDKDEGTESTPTQQIIVQTPEKEACPYDCCVGIDFKRKLCNSDYECRNFKCEIIDSDSDGLGDTEEELLGTNPRIYDTDGDSLSDFQEVRNYKTNPLNKNTDNDRYDDKEDIDPLNPNSAKLKLESEEILPSMEDIAELIDKIKSIEWWASQFLQAQTKDIMVTATNEGDDYTDGFSFDIATYVVFTKKERDGLSCINERFLAKEKVQIQPFSFADKIKPRQSIQKSIKMEVTTIIPSSLKPVECGGLQYCPCNEKVSYVFENLEYEEFP